MLFSMVFVLVSLTGFAGAFIISSIRLWELTIFLFMVSDLKKSYLYGSHDDQEIFLLDVEFLDCVFVLCGFSFQNDLLAFDFEPFKFFYFLLYLQNLC